MQNASQGMKKQSQYDSRIDYLAANASYKSPVIRGISVPIHCLRRSIIMSGVSGISGGVYRQGLDYPFRVYQAGVTLRQPNPPATELF
jgi:hypothetical protein